MKRIWVLGLLILLLAGLFTAACQTDAGVEDDPDAAKIAVAKEALVIPEETDSDLDLPVVLNGVAISWVSSDEDVISSDGHITRQLYDTQATLTATLSLGGIIDTKEFTVAVIPDYFANIDDMINIANTKEALAIPAETDSDLDLPLACGSVAISWVSSDEDVISSTGLVTRQLYNTQVTLTATLSLGGAVDTKEFTVLVTAVVFEEEEAELVEFGFQNDFINSAPNWLRMKYSDENAVFSFTVDNGCVWAYSSLPNDDWVKNLRILSGEFIYWNAYEVEDDQILYDVKVNNAFIEIVLKSDDYIIGYAVIEIHKSPNGGTFVATVLKSVLFPQIDGEYQDVSEEYVKDAIEEIKGAVL